MHQLTPTGYRIKVARSKVHIDYYATSDEVMSVKVLGEKNVPRNQGAMFYRGSLEHRIVTAIVDVYYSTDFTNRRT
jgi:hypothetical protein